MDMLTLFETADAIVSGKHGEKMRLEPEIPLETLKQLTHCEVSEIDLEQFYLYLDNCLNPSHILVHQLLELNLLEKAIETTKHLQQDRTQSLELIVNYLLSHQQMDRALFFWAQLPDKQQFYKKIAQAWLREHDLEQALAFAEDLHQDQDPFLHEIAILLAEKERFGEALAIVEKIENPEISAHTKSNVVHILLNRNQFQKAKEIATTIEMQDYREDAILDVVKVYLNRHKVEEAIAFVDHLPLEKDKFKPAKEIEFYQKKAA